MDLKNHNIKRNRDIYSICGSYHKLVASDTEHQNEIYMEKQIIKLTK